MTTRRHLPIGKRSISYGSVLVPDSPVSSLDPFLLRWSELPPWLQESSNDLIHDHYRPASYSYFRSFQSLFYMHNESVNIHTHLLGSFLFLFTSFTVLAAEARSVSAADIYVLGCFFLGAVVCLTTSAVFHTILNHSQRVSQLGNQLDYVGIVFLITGSFIPSIYYGFYCEPRLQQLYWGMVSRQVVLLLDINSEPGGIDLDCCNRLHSCFSESSVPNSLMEKVQSRNVHCHGSIGRISCIPRFSPLWPAPHEPAN